MSPSLPAPAGLSRRRAWVAISAMFALNGALFGLWASRIPAFKASHTLSHAELGGLLLLLAGGAICAFPLAGRLADHYGAARVTKTFAFIKIAALLALALAPNVVTLALALFLFGAIHGGMDVTMNAWAAEVERWAKRPQMSSYHAMWSLGAGLGAATGFAAISLNASPEIHFTVIGLPLSALLFALGNIAWASPLNRASGGPIFSIPKGQLVLVGLLALGASMGEGAIADWSAVYLVDIGGAPENWAAMGYAVFSATMVVMRLLGDMVTRVVSPQHAARISGLTAAFGAILTVIFPTPPMMLTGFVLMGLGYALIFPLAFSRAANDPNESPGKALAGTATFGYGGMLLGPPLIGFIASATSLRVSFAVLAGLALMIALLSNALKKDV
ncbi:MFS transporter [Shimia marina]|uniref:Inner membrane protein YbjJ n=1 Tax=Shimia marina TaxID=321267 RepID=A0A0P1EJB8_9RHOB|nr:MFS transporter [Shimia marina]CUH50583.1 Inner membrane protein YbjJ [Shimia marina]SFE39800.1 Predicted arabinose efflux permease, MFS family [Shimia marina]